MQQLSLFDTVFKSFYEQLQVVIDNIIVTHDLPNNSIHLYSNISSKGVNAGKETSKSICIFEPEYPPKASTSKAPGKNFIILKVQENKDSSVTLFIRNEQMAQITVPTTATIKIVKSDKVFQHVIFKNNDSSIYSFIRENILYCLANYKATSSFGCCSRFIECSNAKRCVHENKIYSMGCKYRMNLDSGKIFYGENKNI